MAVLTAEQLRGRFQEALGELNFGARAKRLLALGKQLEDLLPKGEVDKLLVELPTEDTFSALAALSVAEGAHAPALPVQLLGHPSQVVRSRAVRLLQAADAEKAFLSEDSNQQLKMWLIRNCWQLPCTPEVLERAKHTFGHHVAWLVLQRTSDEQLFTEWIGKLPNLWPTSNLAGFARLVQVFPDQFLRMLDAKGKYFHEQSWDWLVYLAQLRPAELMERVCLTSNHGYLRCRKGENLKEILIKWGWRHQHELMLRVYKLVASAHAKPGGEKPWVSPHRFVALQQELVASHPLPSMKRKIETIISSYLALPEEQKGVEAAKTFVDLLPRSKGHASAELVDGYWRIVRDLGRGKLEEVVKKRVFNVFAMKVPPPVAVEQFFRVLEDVEPEAAIYSFMMKDVCTTMDGVHDPLMQRVFERFLARDQQDAAVACVKMFEQLREDAESMDVIQASFDALVATLGDVVERTLFRKVVGRMKELDKEVTAARKQAKKRGPPPPQLPLPTRWLRFIPHAAEAPPYVALLHGALQTWALDSEALKVAVERFGTAVFWSTLEHVLLHALGGDTVAHLQWAKDAIKFEALAQVATMKPVPKPTAGSGAAAASLGRQAGLTPKVASAYFTNLEAKKAETFGRDAEKRQNAYTRLASEATKDPDTAAAFDDFLPFLVMRFGGEQENIQFVVMNAILPAFDVELWATRLEQTRALYKTWCKARGGGATQIWKNLGRNIVKRELLTWKEGQTAPTDAGLLGLEVHLGSLDWHEIVYEVIAENFRKEISPLLPEAAMEWAVQTAVPLPKKAAGLLVGEDATRRPLWDFCEYFLEKLARHLSDDKILLGYERGIWTTWPCIGRWWEALLGGALSLDGVRYLLAGVVKHWQSRQASVAIPKDGGGYFVWWEPLRCAGYTAAVRRVLQQIEAGEIPEPEGTSMLAVRSQQVQLMEWATGADGTFIVGTRRSHFDWSRRPQGEVWYNAQRKTVQRTHPDTSLVEELGVLSKVLAKSSPSRQAMWAVIHATEGLVGETSDALLEQLISLLNPRREGMANCVAVQYPYLLNELVDKEDSYPSYSTYGEVKSPDLLTPALEFWLSAKATRDSRVEKLMKRSDFEYLLFFGSSFAEHLSSRRQEWLTECLVKLQAPPEDSTGEFYHHAYRVPSLVRVALLGKGWQRLASAHNPASLEVKCLQTFLWHRETQGLFLKKALRSTDMQTLAIIPSLLYVDGIEVAGELLEKHPSPQEGRVNSEGWTVIQQTGQYQDVWSEIERRFLEAGPPGLKNKIEGPEAEQLLVALGRADHADKALKILGKYAGKFKRAKEGLMQALPNLGPSHARRVIKEVCFAEKAGISLQVAALKLLMELQVPSPLELYRVAWRNGTCHRDVAAIILKKVATSPLTDWSPDDVRDMCDIFDLSSPRWSVKLDASIGAMSAARKEQLPYIAGQVLGLLASTSSWSLPYMPQLVAGLALLPGTTDAAVRALKQSNVQVTETVEAFTFIARQGRLATLAAGDNTGGGKGGSGATELQGVLSSLKQYSPGSGTSIVEHVRTRLNLAKCEPAALRAFVEEQLLWHASILAWPRASEHHSALKSALEVWVKLLHNSHGADAAAFWAKTLGEMEHEVGIRGGPKEFGLLASVVAAHLPSVGLSRTTDAAWALPTLRDFYLRVLAHIEERERDAEVDEPSEVQGPSQLQVKVIVTHWAELVGQGCSAEEAGRLFSRCPAKQARQLVQNLVTACKEKLWWAKQESDKEARVAAAEGSAHLALRWLAEQDTRSQLATLAKLWPKVLESDTTGEVLKTVFALFGQFPTSLQGVALVEEVLTSAPNLHWRPALRWLGTIFPRDAARLWPRVLSTGQAVEDAAAAQDVAELLALCEANKLEVPVLPAKACAGPLVLKALMASPLASGRVAAVCALRELDLRDKHQQQAELLGTMRADADSVVATAAQLAWKSIFGEEQVAEPGTADAAAAEEAEAADEGESGDEGGGGGGGRGGGRRRRRR